MTLRPAEQAKLLAIMSMSARRPDPHPAAADRLAGADQRYTGSRRSLVATLAKATRPLTVAEILKAIGDDLPQSSAYRNLTVLVEAGVVSRVASGADQGRYELAEALSGDHHHHLVCRLCDSVVDVVAFPRLERALDEAARMAASETGFQITDHQIDLVGLCVACQTGST